MPFTRGCRADRHGGFGEFALPYSSLLWIVAASDDEGAAAALGGLFTNAMRLSPDPRTSEVAANPVPHSDVPASDRAIGKPAAPSMQVDRYQYQPREKRRQDTRVRPHALAYPDAVILARRASVQRIVSKWRHHHDDISAKGQAAPASRRHESPAASDARPGPNANRMKRTAVGDEDEGQRVLVPQRLNIEQPPSVESGAAFVELPVPETGRRASLTIRASGRGAAATSIDLKRVPDACFGVTASAGHRRCARPRAPRSCRTAPRARDCGPMPARIRQRQIHPARRSAACPIVGARPHRLLDGSQGRHRATARHGVCR